MSPLTKLLPSFFTGRKLCLPGVDKSHCTNLNQMIRFSTRCIFSDGGATSVFL